MRFLNAGGRSCRSAKALPQALRSLTDIIHLKVLKFVKHRLDGCKTARNVMDALTFETDAVAMYTTRHTAVRSVQMNTVNSVTEEPSRLSRWQHMPPQNSS
jgi:hypothetical protein